MFIFAKNTDVGNEGVGNEGVGNEESDDEHRRSSKDVGYIFRTINISMA